MTNLLPEIFVVQVGTHTTVATIGKLQPRNGPTVRRKFSFRNLLRFCLNVLGMEPIASPHPDY